MLLVTPGPFDAGGIPPLRPICMSDNLRTLVATALARATRAAAATCSGPAQLRIAVPNGCEHSLDQIDSHLARNPTDGVLQMDHTSAFNDISRAAAMAVEERAFPSLSPALSGCKGRRRR